MNLCDHPLISKVELHNQEMELVLTGENDLSFHTISLDQFEQRSIMFLSCTNLKSYCHSQTFVVMHDIKEHSQCQMILSYPVLFLTVHQNNCLLRSLFCFTSLIVSALKIAMGH